jgi:hypothetical protein
VRIPLRLGSRDVTADGEVVRVRESRASFGSVFEHGVRFASLPRDAHDALELHCAHDAVPTWHARYRQSMPLLAQAFERFANLRTFRRRSVQLPVVVRVCPAEGPPCELGIGMLEEMSAAGARLILANPIEPGSRVTYDVPGTDIDGAGTVVFNRAFESPGNVRFAVGIRGDRAVARRAWASSFRRSRPSEVVHA